MSSFADLTNTLRELNSQMDESSKKSESLFETLGNNPVLSRLVFPISSLILKLTGLTKVMRVFQSQEARRNKEMQKQAGGYKFLIKQFKAMEDAVAGGSETAENYMAMLNELQKIGVISAKGKPTGGFFNNLKSFIGTGLRVFKNFLLYGTLLVLGIALLLPIIQKNLPKIKEFIPTLKEKFTELMEFLSPLFQAIKAFFSILFDPNASWMDKLNAWFKVVWELLMVLGQGLIATLTKLVPAAVKFLVGTIVPALFRFGGELLTYFKEEALPAILTKLEAFVRENAETVKKTTSAVMKIGGGAVAGAVAGGSLGLLSGGVFSVPLAIAGGLAGGVIGLGSVLQGRANGGPVMAGRPYMVGEKGPEMFVPNNSGTIVPNGAGNNINVHVSGRVGASDHELRDIARRVGQMINKEVNRTTSFGVRL